MRFSIITIGKIREKFVSDGVNEFLKRINRYAPFNLVPIKEERMLKGATEALIIQKEGRRILEKVPHDGCWVALDRLGKEMTSQQHFDFLNDQAEKGVKKITYLIGGPLGLSPEVLNKSDFILSLSRMTLTHELSALYLMEQIYRYLNFMAGEKYHKEKV
jgi:23S rRNA (pseudouridine1915-N3)-methyltransferase